MTKEDSDNDDDENDTAPEESFVPKNRGREAAKQLFCGGLAGSVAKTVTAPLSRLTILFQVHSLVTTKYHRPKFAMSVHGGFHKIIERGGIISLWKGNLTSVLHRFPYSAINFFVYEHSMDILSSYRRQQRHLEEEEAHETAGQLVRRVTLREPLGPSRLEETLYKFTAGALAGMCAVTACYPLDLIRTRLSTELEGKEHYRGIVDAMVKIHRAEGITGFYAGLTPTLLVCTVPLVKCNG
jgi:solute carrier family 25 (mitochondrial phosphate transporter), member 23/24/25/41